jgi:hypothetical protein
MFDLPTAEAVSEAPVVSISGENSLYIADASSKFLQKPVF